LDSSGEIPFKRRINIRKGRRNWIENRTFLNSRNLIGREHNNKEREWNRIDNNIKEQERD
jgi:hypothetical protein